MPVGSRIGAAENVPYLGLHRYIIYRMPEIGADISSPNMGPLYGGPDVGPKYSKLELSSILGLALYVLMVPELGLTFPRPILGAAIYKNVYWVQSWGCNYCVLNWGCT